MEALPILIHSMASSPLHFTFSEWNQLGKFRTCFLKLLDSPRNTLRWEAKEKSNERSLIILFRSIILSNKVYQILETLNYLFKVIVFGLYVL